MLGKKLNIICIGQCSITMDKITDKQHKNASILAKCHRIHSVRGWLAALLLSWGEMKEGGDKDKLHLSRSYFTDFLPQLGPNFCKSIIFQ